MGSFGKYHRFSIYLYLGLRSNSSYNTITVFYTGMKRIELVKGGIEYTIVKRNNHLGEPNVKGSNYARLTHALFDRITGDQKTKITDANNTIFFSDLVECFKLIQTNRTGNTPTKCVCGVPISFVHCVQNRDDGLSHIIGSECINNWDLTLNQKRQIRTEDLTQYSDRNEIGGNAISLCYFCLKNTTKRNCNNCSLKKYCSAVFTAWKKYASDRAVIYFTSPYQMRDKVKSVGAKWDAINKRWYVSKRNKQAIAILELQVYSTS